MICGNAIDGIRLGAAAQRAWPDLDEATIRDMAKYLSNHPGATFQEYVAHSLNGIAENVRV